MIDWVGGIISTLVIGWIYTSLPSREGEMEEKLADLRLLSEGQFRIGSNQSAVSLCIPYSHLDAGWAILGVCALPQGGWQEILAWGWTCIPRHHQQLKNQQQFGHLAKPPTANPRVWVLGTLGCLLYICSELATLVPFQTLAELCENGSLFH